MNTENGLTPEEQYQFTTTTQRGWDHLWQQGIITTEEVSRLSSPERMIETCRENVALTQALYECKQELTKKNPPLPRYYHADWRQMALCGFAGGTLLCLFALITFIFPAHRRELQASEDRLTFLQNMFDEAQDKQSTLEQQLAERDLRIEAYVEATEALKDQSAKADEKLFEAESIITCLRMPPEHRTGSWSGVCD